MVSSGACSASATGSRGWSSAGANALIVDAADIELDRPVTIKLVRPEWAESAEFRAQVRRRDAARCRRCRTPTSPPCTTGARRSSASARRSTSSSEYLAGGSLRDLFDRGRHLDPSQALMVGLEACRGLDFAHRRGLVHTELTPSKLVFGDDRRLRIVDFGLARLLGERHWAEPATVPTHVARYCSPEQALAQPVDGKTDVYSLALVLVEAVTGAVPFAARSTVATLSARVGKLMPVSADLGSLAAVLEKAGRPDPEDRSTAARVRARARQGGREPAPTGTDPDPRRRAVRRGPGDDAAPRRPDRRDHPAGGRAAAAPPGPPRRTCRGRDRPAEAAPGARSRRRRPSPTGPRTPRRGRRTRGSDRSARRRPRRRRALYDGDADRTIDELAELARPAREPRGRRRATPAAGDSRRAAAPRRSPRRAASTRRRRRWLAGVGALARARRARRRSATSPTCCSARRRTRCPTSSGSTEADARAQTADFDWEIDVQRERSDEEPDAGEIIRTAPEAGERLAEGEPFLVVVSEGPEFRALPDVAGRDAGRRRDRARRTEPDRAARHPGEPRDGAGGHR